MKNYKFNKEFQEIYSDFKIKKTAKKRGGKNITLDLQESKKKYSQYIGYIKNKMKGGADYNWDLLETFFKKISIFFFFWRFTPFGYLYFLHFLSLH